MKINFETKAQQEIWQIMDKINNSWVHGDPAEMNEFLHKDFSTSKSDFIIIGKGREDCIRSYTGFAQSANILDFQYININIFIIGNIAIVRYNYKITYEMNENFEGSREEAFIFTKEKDKWLAIWRLVIKN